MVRIFLLDNRLLQEPISLCFGQAEAERLDAIKNPQRRLESLAALAALDKLIKISFGDANFEILRSKDGKPYFKDGNISFSLSHSGDISVAAICDEKDSIIGVDVEKITDRTNVAELAERFFDKSERLEFAELGKTSRAFFNLWTKKEAYAKMTGDGLASLLGERGQKSASEAERKCYEFYNNKDAYSLSFCCSLKNNNVEFYNNSKNIKIKNQH